jgi:hypothetical protein
MALNLAARVNDELTVHTQGVISEDETETHTTLSYAFADYKLSHRFSIRAGQVKQPFGLHSEVFAVGTLRPFLELPQAIYGPVGFAGESYKGVGILGALEAGRWTVGYDAYVGGIDLLKLAVQEEYYHGASLPNATRGIERESIRNIIGGRLVLSTPVQGLRLGASAHSGVLNETASNRRTVVAGQISYQSNKVTLESEVAHENQVNDEHSTGGYVLAAYRLTPEWQVGVQGDYLRNVYHGVDPSAAPSLQDHKEVAAVLSYWVVRALVVKLEYHWVDGNRFAIPLPEDLAGVVTANQLRTRTHLVQCGVQFSF